MNSKDRIVLYLLAACVAFLVINTVFFSGRNLRMAVKKLEKAEKEITSSIKMIDESKVRIDSMHKDLQRFKLYIQDIQGRVEILDLEKRVNDKKFAARRDSIRNRLNELYREIQLVGEDLPEIPVVSIHSEN